MIDIPDWEEDEEWESEEDETLQSLRLVRRKTVVYAAVSALLGGILLLGWSATLLSMMLLSFWLFFRHTQELRSCRYDALSHLLPLMMSRGLHWWMYCTWAFACFGATSVTPLDALLPWLNQNYEVIVFTQFCISVIGFVACMNQAHQSGPRQIRQVIIDVCSSLFILFILSALPVYWHILNTSMVWFVLAVFAIFMFDLQFSMWNRILHCTPLTHLFTVNLEAIFVSTITTSAFVFGAINVVSYIPAVTCPLHVIWQETPRHCGMNFLSHEALPKFASELFLLVGVDAMFVKLYPIQISSAWTTACVCLTSIVARCLGDLIRDTDAAGENSKQRVLTLLLLEHLFGAVVTYLGMNLFSLVIPVADVYFDVKQLPLNRQIEVMEALQGVLRREGLVL